MKVLATSDLHGNLPEVPECDVLIIGGDICPDYMRSLPKSMGWKIDKGEQRQRHWLDTEFRRWLSEVPAATVVGIAGNHDYVFEHSFLIRELNLTWTYLQDQLCEVAGGLRIWGTPWVPNLPYWAFYGSDEALQARAELIPKGIDILVTHGPPYLHGDFVPGGTEKQASKYGNVHGMHVGEHHLNVAINRAHPGFVVCGHIHEGHGHYHHVGAKGGVYNVAHVDALYDPVNPIVEIPV